MKKKQEEKKESKSVKRRVVVQEEKETPKKEEPKNEVTEIQVIKSVENQVEREETKNIVYSRPQLEQIKSVYAKGATDVEFANFILVSARTGLDIFKKQIYLVKRWDSKLGQEVATPQAGIDGFRAVAEKTGKYAGNDDPTFTGTSKILDGKKEVEVPEKATVTVYKIVEGVRCPFTASARWAEYYPGEKQGFMWRTKPHVMLGKCAEALALRKAFPNVFVGLYEPAEMDLSGKGNDEQDKQKKGFEKLQEIISRFSKEECADYLDKMMKSEKYTEAQKNQLKTLVEKRVKELKGNKKDESEDIQIEVDESESQ